MIPGVADRVISVSDADDEVRHALRLVVDAARRGVPLGRIAVLYGNRDPYARLIGDAGAPPGPAGIAPPEPLEDPSERLARLVDLDERRTALVLRRWINETTGDQPTSNETETA